MLVAGENNTEKEVVAQSSVANDKAQSIKEPKAETGKQTQGVSEIPQGLPTTGKHGKALASPAVRRVAREMDVDLVDVAGSGKKGRVYKDDVVAFSQQGSSVNSHNVQTTANNTVGEKRVEPIRGIKAIMAKAMQNSVSTIPHFTYCEEIDLTKLIALRKELKEVYAKQEIKLTMMPFFMKAMSLALKEYPIVNSQGKR